MFLLVIGSSAVALPIIARLSRTARLFNQRQRRWWLLGGELMLSGGLFASFGLGILASVTFMLGACIACAVAWCLCTDQERPAA